MDSVFDSIYRLIDFALPFDWTRYMFMKRALLAIILISPMCAAMGVPATSFRMIFFSSAISHSVFAGVALGLITGMAPGISMVLFGVIVGLGIIHVRRHSELSYDTVIGVFFSFTVALGIVIISTNPGVMRTLDSIIYGDILTISETEICLFSLLFIVTFAFLTSSYNRLILKGINDRLASTHGIRTKYYDYTFAALLAIVITASIRAVGLLLVTALLVVPAGAGRNLARSARQQFWFAVLIGAFSGVAGLVVSSYWNTATGATIILFAGIIFMLTQYLPWVLKKLVRA